jgi:hypothetical protein
MTRVVMVPQEEYVEDVRSGVQQLFEEELGPDITADARMFCPVDTGRMQRAIDYQVVERKDWSLELQVGVFPDDKGSIPYAAATNCGFHGPEIVRAHMRNGHPVREHIREGNTPAQPFLDPALFQER